LSSNELQDWLRARINIGPENGGDSRRGEHGCALRNQFKLTPELVPELVPELTPRNRGLAELSELGHLSVNSPGRSTPPDLQLG
jgi:hypothetical protein